jgi:hypothetical protein
MTIVTESDFDVVMSHPDVEKYRGKWVAVVNHKIVAVGMTLSKVYREAIREYPESVSYVMRVPEKYAYIL